MFGRRSGQFLRRRRRGVRNGGGGEGDLGVGERGGGEGDLGVGERGGGEGERRGGREIIERSGERTGESSTEELEPGESESELIVSGIRGALPGAWIEAVSRRSNLGFRGMLRGASGESCR